MTVLRLGAATLLLLTAAACGETTPAASTAEKCERCWHYRADVGAHADHPTLCGRCYSNLFGAGEQRKFA